MKYFFLTPGCFDKGGISRYSRYQIQALREILGADDVWIASLMGKTYDSFEEKFDVDFSLSDNGKWNQIKFALKFVLKSIQEKPKYIHVAHVNFSGLACVIARLIGAKTILNVYGLEIWSKLSKDASYGLRHVDYIISDCHNTKQYLVDNDIRQEKDITVIWDCVDLDKFQPQAPDVIQSVAEKYNIPTKSERRAIVTLGRLSRAAIHKGYHRLLETFAKLDQSRYYLVFAGKGDLVDELNRIASELTIQDNVYFTGMVHEEDMAGIYSYADIFSLVSEVGDKKGEGIPLTPLEAMACGTPIVVGNMDGSREAVFDNNGICIDSHNQNALLEAINTIASHIEKYSNAALRVSREYFSYKIFEAKHKAYYSKLDS